MCNACGFGCCAWDGFDGCGCEDCPNPACWNDEYDDDHVPDGSDYGDEDMSMEEALERDAEKLRQLGADGGSDG